MTLFQTENPVVLYACVYKYIYLFIDGKSFYPIALIYSTSFIYLSTCHPSIYLSIFLAAGSYIYCLSIYLYIYISLPIYLLVYFSTYFTQEVETLNITPCCFSSNIEHLSISPVSLHLSLSLSINLSTLGRSIKKLPQCRLYLCSFQEVR